MEKLTGVQKVAIILSTLDADAAAGIIKELDDEKIALVTAEMTKFNRIDKELVDRVLDDLSLELYSNTNMVKYDNTSFKKLLKMGRCFLYHFRCLRRPATTRLCV
jgi:flagellar motor switch protein FliG